MFKKISRLFKELWRQLPEVRPYTGASSLKTSQDRQMRVINGRVVTMATRNRNKPVQASSTNENSTMEESRHGVTTPRHFTDGR